MPTGKDPLTASIADGNALPTLADVVELGRTTYSSDLSVTEPAFSNKLSNISITLHP